MLNEEQRGTDMGFAQRLGRGGSELLCRYLHVVGREARGALRYLHLVPTGGLSQTPLKPAAYQNLQEPPRSP